jgi:predicted dehydrogenase
MIIPLKVAIVGLGWWATPIGHAANRSDKLDLAVCYTRNPEKRAAYAKDFGCQAAESYEAILTDPALEGVLLTTPNTAHAWQIEAALRAGKHVWVEKPITNTLAEVPGVLEVWRDTGLVLAVGHCYRRAAGHRKMKQLIEDGTVGRPLWAEAAFTSPAGQGFTKEVWRYFKAECPGGPLMQMGIHHCDTLQYLLGRPSRVIGVHKHLATPAEIDDVSVTIYEHASGAVSNVTTCFTSPGTFTMKLHGTEAVLSLEMIRANLTYAERTNQETTLLMQKKGEAGWTTVELPEMPDMIQDELDEFAECVRTGEPPETGLLEATYALAMVEGSVRSSAAGKPLEMQALLDGIDLEVLEAL